MVELEMLAEPILGTGCFFVSYDALHKIESAGLDNDALGVAFRLFTQLAYGRIAYYSAPDDTPYTPDDDERMCIRFGLEAAEWQRIRRKIEPLFNVQGGKWRLADNAFVILSEPPEQPRPEKPETARRDQTAPTLFDSAETEGARG